MGKKSKHEKKSTYLTNLLFLFFDKYWSNPDLAGKKIACSIVKAAEMVCPTRREFNGTGEKRRMWIRKFLFSIIKNLGCGDITSRYSNEL